MIFLKLKVGSQTVDFVKEWSSLSVTSGGNRHTMLTLQVFALVVVGFAFSYAKPSTEDYSVPQSLDSTDSPVEKLITKSAGSVEDRERLIKSLLEDYDTRNYPSNFTTSFSLALQKFTIDEDLNNLIGDVWLREAWTDPRLAFDPAKYGGISSLRIPINDIWRPDIILYNIADGPSGFRCVETNAVVFPEGKVLWVPPCSITAFCNLTLDTAPYEEQTCTLKFGSWTFDGLSMDLQVFYSDNELDYYEPSDRWEITNLHPFRESKTYPCCVEPYITINYDLSFRRRRT